MRPDPIPNHFFTENRLELMRQLDADSMLLMQSADNMVQSGDAVFPFHQDTNFFYYTGIESPGCSLMLLPKNGDNPEVILFIPPVDPEQEKWWGKMLTRERAQKISGIEKIQFSDTLLPTF